MRARQWLLLLLIVLIAATLLYPHGKQTVNNPTRYAAYTPQEKNAILYFVDENGAPLHVKIDYVVDGKRHTITADGSASIPENATVATIYAKGRVPVTIKAITNGRKVIIPVDPTRIKRTVTFKGCARVFVAPIGAPLVDEFNCNDKISLPEGVYRFAAMDKNGCIIDDGNVTLRDNREIRVSSKTGSCKQANLRIQDAENGAPIEAWVTANGVTMACKNGSCEIGIPKRCTDAFAWRDGYMRGYDHVCDANATILLNKAVAEETLKITTDGTEIVVTDRYGVVLHVNHNSTADVLAPDSSYYIYAERWPLVTKVLATVPGNNNINVLITPAPARLTLKSGETAYVNDAPVCKGPKTCSVPSLTAIRIVDGNGNETVFVALPGEERII